MHTERHNSSKSLRWLLLTAAVVVPFSGVASAELKTPELTRPDPSVQEVLVAKEAEIQAIVESALDAQLPTDSRVDAVRQLSGVYFDYLLANSQALVRDADPEVAHATVLSLAGQIAMIPDPDILAHHDETEYDHYQGNLVQMALESLRLALEHSDATVVDEAAAFLSSRGDLQGMVRIQSLIDEGKMPAEKGIGFLSLGPVQSASSLIERYARDADPDVQAAAINQLSYNPDYTAVVRDLALSPGTPSEVITAALPGLAATDQGFLSYGLALTQNEDLDDAVRTKALEATVRFTIQTGTSEAEARSLEPLLGETAAELSSPAALQAIEALRSQYQIE